MKLNNDSLASHRRISQSPPVAAVRMSRQDTAARTRSRSHNRSRLDHHGAAAAADLIYDNTTQMRQENFTIPPR
jgi:hypothetical protein